MAIGIYIHVPFCAKKCPYCDFYSCSYTLQTAEKYTNGIIRDIENFKGHISADTIYFGGGTPSLIPAECIEKILESIYKKFNVVDPEMTIEVNPCTVNSEKLKKYRDMGINRLSIGVQSADNSELEFLGRNHTFKKAEEIIISAEKSGFKNISCDLMVGLPNQTIDSLKNSIESLAELPIQHISSYILKIEKGTPFDNFNIIRQMPNEDLVSDMYLFMVDILESKGFEQYEISNFAKKGFESKHNLKYWKRQEYIGFGPSAHSFYNGLRYYYSPNIEGFIKSAPDKIVTDDSPADDNEKIMLNLRLAEGININDFPNIKSKILSKASMLEKNGLIRITNSNLRLTPKGFLVSNSIIADLLF